MRAAKGGSKGVEGGIGLIGRSLIDNRPTGNKGGAKLLGLSYTARIL